MQDEARVPQRRGGEIDAQTVQRFRRIAQTACYLTAQGNGGSGFFIGPQHILTAQHVWEGITETNADHIDILCYYGRERVKRVSILISEVSLVAAGNWSKGTPNLTIDYAVIRTNKTFYHHISTIWEKPRSRGWLSLFPPNEVSCIPSGELMAVSMSETGHVIASGNFLEDDGGDHFTHDAATSIGRSGCLLFASDSSHPVGLHIRTNLKQNFAVKISSIWAHLNASHAEKIDVFNQNRLKSPFLPPICSKGVPILNRSTPARHIEDMWHEQKKALFMKAQQSSGRSFSVRLWESIHPDIPIITLDLTAPEIDTRSLELLIGSIHRKINPAWSNHEALTQKVHEQPIAWHNRIGEDLLDAAQKVAVLRDSKLCLFFDSVDNPPEWLMSFLTLAANRCNPATARYNPQIPQYTTDNKYSRLRLICAGNVATQLGSFEECGVYAPAAPEFEDYLDDICRVSSGIALAAHSEKISLVTSIRQLWEGGAASLGLRHQVGGLLGVAQGALNHFPAVLALENDKMG